MLARAWSRSPISLSRSGALSFTTMSSSLHLETNGVDIAIGTSCKQHSALEIDSKKAPQSTGGRPELRLPELHREFALLSTSFATNNPDASSLFFWELEFKESQSSFSLFGVNTLPYIRLVGPNVKSLKDSDQMDQGDFSRLASSMAEFIESRTKLTMGPTSTVPLSSPGLRTGS
ncbi:hypothetical protein Tsubulata_042964 [Turnera subulata]|uniref:Thioredoxin domain-containing protein n=1 Tax=Turnera subulata TaxID=218843 RepID=A0A9Q0F357_9ROSI|nr:hypothetical protein Tsubulata_042964 [Turnera subulata]